jgi:hypothetical protein
LKRKRKSKFSLCKIWYFFWNVLRKMLSKTRLTLFGSSKDDCFRWAEKSANDSIGQEPDLIWIGAIFEGEVSKNDGLSHEKLLLLLLLYKLLLLLLKLLLKFDDNCCFRLGFDEVKRFMKFYFSLGLISFLSVGGLWEVGVDEDWCQFWMSQRIACTENLFRVYYTYSLKLNF